MQITSCLCVCACVYVFAFMLCAIFCHAIVNCGKVLTHLPPPTAPPVSPAMHVAFHYETFILSYFKLVGYKSSPDSVIHLHAYKCTYIYTYMLSALPCDRACVIKFHFMTNFSLTSEHWMKFIFYLWLFWCVATERVVTVIFLGTCVNIHTL